MFKWFYESAPEVINPPVKKPDDKAVKERMELLLQTEADRRTADNRAQFKKDLAYYEAWIDAEHEDYRRNPDSYPPLIEFSDDYVIIRGGERILVRQNIKSISVPVLKEYWHPRDYSHTNMLKIDRNGVITEDKEDLYVYQSRRTSRFSSGTLQAAEPEYIFKSYTTYWFYVPIITLIVLSSDGTFQFEFDAGRYEQLKAEIVKFAKAD